MTSVIDGQHYRLPDGTIVRAIHPSGGNVRLDAPLGPLYLFDAALRAWRALHDNAAEDCFVIVPCDLIDADLTPIDSLDSPS